MGCDSKTLDQVWEKGRAIGNQDQTVWRKDECGAWIRYDQYGSEVSDFGWKIASVSTGGSSGPADLRPFHWQNDFNRSTSVAVCRVKADREGVPSAAQLDSPRNAPAQSGPRRQIERR
jgi:hypothetical protein